MGETIAWGFKIKHYRGEKHFNNLRKHGELECVGLGVWVLVIKRLTSEQAIAKYGPITVQEFGPRGAWRSVTYGNKKFISSVMKPP